VFSRRSLTDSSIFNYLLNVGTMETIDATNPRDRIAERLKLIRESW